MSAYIKFSQAKRAEIQAANPGAGFGELGKLIGAEWQKLSPDEKASYGAAGKTIKTIKTTKTRKTRSNKGGHHMRKTKEMHNGLPVYTNANLAKSNNSNSNSNSNKKNNNNNNNKTKKARRANPYANFVKAHWAEAKAKNPGGSLSDISKQIAAMWKAQK
jgi:hypothetical protein